MRDEEKKRLGPLTKGFKVGRGQNLEWKKDFVKKRGFGSREHEEISRCLSENETRLAFKYIWIQTSRSIKKVLRGVKNKILIDRKGIDG